MMPLTTSRVSYAFVLRFQRAVQPEFIRTPR
jgi:hypothetical protein